MREGQPPTGHLLIDREAPGSLRQRRQRGENILPAQELPRRLPLQVPVLPQGGRAPAVLERLAGRDELGIILDDAKAEDVEGPEETPDAGHVRVPPGDQHEVDVAQSGDDLVLGPTAADVGGDEPGVSPEKKCGEPNEHTENPAVEPVDRRHRRADDPPPKRSLQHARSGRTGAALIRRPPRPARPPTDRLGRHRPRSPERTPPRSARPRSAM